MHSRFVSAYETNPSLLHCPLRSAGRETDGRVTNPGR